MNETEIKKAFVFELKDRFKFIEVEVQYLDGDMNPPDSYMVFFKVPREWTELAILSTSRTFKKVFFEMSRDPLAVIEYEANRIAEDFERMLRLWEESIPASAPYWQEYGSVTE